MPFPLLFCRRPALRMRLPCCAPSATRYSFPAMNRRSSRSWECFRRPFAQKYEKLAAILLSLLSKIARDDPDRYNVDPGDRLPVRRYGAAGRTYGAAAGGRGDGSFYQPLPQGTDRRTRRSAGKCSESAVRTALRTGKAKGDDSRFDRRTGQTDARIAHEDRTVLRGRPLGRPLPSLSSQTPDPCHGSTGKRGSNRWPRC